MDEHRHLSVCRRGEQAPELQVLSARCVADAETEPEATLVEPAFHQLDETLQLILGRRLVEKRIRRTTSPE